MAFARLALLLSAVALASARAFGDCPTGNLLALEGVRAEGAAASAAVSGRFEPEGAPGGVVFAEPFVVDLGVRRTVGALLVQADAGVLISVAASTDGESWNRVAELPALDGAGLRSRSASLAEPVDARYLRVMRTDAVGPFRVSALAAWCRPPERPEELQARVVALRGTVQAARFAIAAAGAILLAWSVRRRPATPRARRIRDAALGLLGLVAVCAWWNFGLFHFGGYVHTWDQFHYFLGAKYFPELGYTRLYECVTAADLEDAPAIRAGERKLREMRTNTLVSASGVADDPGSCTEHFSAERWLEFKRDVAFFRGSIHPARWERIFLDHGFNAPPAWGVMGSTLTRGLSASRASVLALALIDPVLLVAMWLFVVHAFGWRAGVVAALWWGTNRLADFGWTGGGLLRQDWLVLAVAGVCFVRRGFAFAGGLALAWSALLRIFPGFMIAGLVLQVVARSVAERRLALDREHRRFAAGALVAVALIVPLSSIVAGGPGAWMGFIEDARANIRSTGGNVVGLMAVLSYESAGRLEAMIEPGALDPDGRWLAAKEDVHASRLGVHRGLAVGFAVLFAFAVRREPPWAALALGAGLVPIVSFVPSYYYSILLVLGLIACRRGPAVGVVLCGLSMATHVVAWLWPDSLQMDTRFAWASLATVVAVLVLTSNMLRRGGDAEEPW